MQNNRWDAVFASSCNYLNKRLQEEIEKYVFSFKYEDTGIVLEGTFNAWSIAPNGSGEIIQFHTPFKTGTATIKSTQKTYKLDDVVPLVQLQLTFIEGTNPGRQKSLVFHCDTVGKKVGDKTSGAVTVVDPDTENKLGLDPLAKDLIPIALSQCFINNRDKLTFVFANIELTPPVQAAWLVLRTLAYCYQQNEKDTLGNFGVMGMFSVVDISSYSRVFDSALLRTDDDFGFIISGSQFLSHVVLPGLPEAFKGSSASEYTMKGANIVNNGDVHLDSVKVGAIYYPPRMTSLNMHIEEDYVQTYVQGKCPITGLADAYIDFSMTEKEVATFDLNSDAISFTATDKEVSHNSHIPWWEKILGGITFGIMNIIVDVISLGIENAVRSEISASGLDAKNLGAFQVTWHNQAKTTFTDGGLADNFYMRGKIESENFTMTSTPNVDTYHWDTVYVADFDVINEAIKKNGSFPTNFDYTDSATKVHIKGDWVDWALALGGSGSLIHMKCSISSGTVNGLGETADLSGSTLTIQFELEQVLDPKAAFKDPTAKSGTGKPKAQQFPTKAQPSNTGETQTVTVVAHSYPKLDPNKAPVINDILQTIFQNYFNAHLGDIKATFHVMMINEEADKDSFQWIKPSAISYAIDSPTKGATLSNTAFGVLCMTDGGQPGRLQEQAVDVAALVGLPEGANSAFIISPEKVTKHMLLKGAISTIQGSKASDFEIHDSGLNIVNVNDLTWGNFQTKDGIISPKIKTNNFLMRLDGDHIHLEISNASYSPSAGITVFMNLEQDFGFKTVKRKDGKYVFIPDVKSFGNPTIHSNVQVSQGMKIAEIVIGVVAGIAALAGGISEVGDLIANAADTAVTSATEGTVNITSDIMSDIGSQMSDDEWETISLDSAKDADTGVSDPSNPAQVQKGSFLLSSKFRVYCGITAAIAGLTESGMAVAGPLTSLDYDKIPAFDDFAANVLGASKFPVLSNYELLGAQLRTSLVAGIKLS